MNSLDSETPQPTPTLRYRPEIDGLRAIAVLVVVFFHAGLGCSGGYVGVDVFFVISGFLITALLLRDIESDRFSLADFWERRIRRIAPALIVTVLATLVAAWFVFLPADFTLLGRATVALALCGSNIFHWRIAGYFGPTADTLPLLHTWSLAVEEQFYIIIPLVLFALGTWRRAWLRPALVLAFALSLGFGIWATPRMASSSFFLLPARAWELLLGSLLAAYPAVGERTPRWVKELVCLGGLTAIGFSVYSFDENTPFPGTAALVPCLGAAAIIWANRSLLTFSGRLLAWKPLVFVGQVSYSFYLVHWPLFVFSLYWFRNELQWPALLGLVGVAFVLAVISWGVVETPVRKKWVLVSRRRLFAITAAALFLMFAGGEFAAFRKGFPSRFDPQTLACHAVRFERLVLRGLSVEDAVKGKIPEIGDPAGETQYMVWGDSHAIALTPALDELGKRKGLRGYKATYMSTAPLLNFVSELPHALKESRLWSKSIVDFAIERRVKSVFMIAHWLNYDSDPQFEQALHDTVTTLINAGIHVVIVRDVPDQLEDVPWLLARASLFGDTRTVGTSLKKHREQNKRSDALFERIAGPNVTVLDTAPYFVDEAGVCRAEFEGKPLYRDSHHLSVKGALHLIPLFEDLFNPAPQPQQRK